MCVLDGIYHCIVCVCTHDLTLRPFSSLISNGIYTWVYLLAQLHIMFAYYIII